MNLLWLWDRNMMWFKTYKNGHVPSCICLQFYGGQILVEIQLWRLRKNILLVVRVIGVLKKHVLMYDQVLIKLITSIFFHWYEGIKIHKSSSWITSLPHNTVAASSVFRVNSLNFPVRSLPELSPNANHHRLILNLHVYAPDFMIPTKPLAY